MSKYALITGASGGIGQAVALKLAQEGYHLYLHYNENETGIRELIKNLQHFGGEYIPIQANLSHHDGYKKMTEQIFSLDCFIYTSGSSYYGLLTDMDIESIEDTMMVHVTSPILLAKELLPKMIRKQSGQIVLISSIWGQVGAACEVVYSAAKGAQISFVKALSKEVALNGIRVNGVAPGAVNTRMLDQFTDEERNELKGEIPMGRLGEPNEIAEAVYYLISDKAAYITGQILHVNGGWYT